MNTKENAIIRTVPAVGALNKVPGFDPLKHLQEAVNEKGEKVYQLGLRYKRLWFRLAYPGGRLLLNPLRITGQMAIFEAQVFFRREDPTPASSFTSTKTVRENRDYARAAQDEALSIALDNAGFGIQLCDVSQGADDETGDPAEVFGTGQAKGKKPAPTVKAEEPPVPVQPVIETPAAEPEAVAAEPVPAPKTVAPPVQKTIEAVPAEAMEERAVVPSETVEAASSTVDQSAAPAAMETGPAEIPVESAAQPVRHSTSATVVHFPAQQTSGAEPAQPRPEQTDPTVTAAPAETIPGYTEDMPVEEITQRMTLEEAMKMVVPSGACKGWSMSQVLDRRPSSLKFFITPFCDLSNPLKAAATLLLQVHEQQKAG